MLFRIIKTFLPDLLALAATAVSHFFLLLWAMEALKKRKRVAACVALCVSLLFVWTGIIFQLPRFYDSLPHESLLYWLRGISIAWGIAVTGIWVAAAFLRLLKSFRGEEPVDESKRALLKSAQGVVLACPVVLTGVGIFVERTRFVQKEVALPVRNLPKDLDGLRIVQLSDMHVSPYLTPQELGRAVSMANEFNPHLAMITGDLITRRGDPLEEALQRLSKLKTSSGIWGCLGNHEVYAQAEDEATEIARRLGIRILRHEAEPLRFGSSILNVAGVDYQKMHGPYLAEAEELKRSDAVNLLLSHNPDVFSKAAAQGWDAVLSGHTHGGQVTVEILYQHLNVARFFTPFVYGTYQEKGSSIYVTRGLGTVGVPARIGAPPEIACIRLCAS